MKGNCTAGDPAFCLCHPGVCDSCRHDYTDRSYKWKLNTPKKKAKKKAKKKPKKTRT